MKGGGASASPYPRWWRTRCGEEWRALLEETPPGPGDLLELMREMRLAHRLPERPVVAAVAEGEMSVRSWTGVGSVLSLLLVVPAWIFVLAAVGRSVQPTMHEPAHTALMVFLWLASTPGWLKVLWGLVGPTLAFLLALSALAAQLRGSAAFARDWAVLKAIVARHWRVFAAFGGLAGSGLFMLLVVVHAVAG
ncbi:MAG: hypothetical protein K6V97_08550 [Actinomycetia bacterium]|nr:hypothetical protein [Actinomycetes bacterium]